MGRDCGDGVCTRTPPPRAAHSLDHVLLLLHFGESSHLVLEQVQVSWAALSETGLATWGATEGVPSRPHHTDTWSFTGVRRLHVLSRTSSP